MLISFWRLWHPGMLYCGHSIFTPNNWAVAHWLGLMSHLSCCDINNNLKTKATTERHTDRKTERALTEARVCHPVVEPCQDDSDSHGDCNQLPWFLIGTQVIDLHTGIFEVKLYNLLVNKNKKQSELSNGKNWGQCTKCQLFLHTNWPQICPWGGKAIPLWQALSYL